MECEMTRKLTVRDGQKDEVYKKETVVWTELYMIVVFSLYASAHLCFVKSIIMSSFVFCQLDILVGLS